ncbi:hypothetical protein BC829DRAFT_60939 [Chytridium lagenaria]|nr:hypothetical protein BC829DRAFT_60939 [Chytridium lagenaria]
MRKNYRKGRASNDEVNLTVAKSFLKIREGVFKIGGLAGAPRLINALDSLQTHLTDRLPQIPSYLSTLLSLHNIPQPPTWQHPALPTVDLNEGEAYFRTVYGPTSDQLMDQLGMLHPGLAEMVIREYAGNYVKRFGLFAGG